MTGRRRSGPAAAALGLICAAAGLAACGGDDVVVRPAPPPNTTSTPREAPLTGRVAKARPLSITVTDAAKGRFRYRAPRAVAAGLVEIRLRNDAEVPRRAQLWRITGNHSVAEARRVSRPVPGWLHAAGGVALTEPGARGRTVQLLEPGRYYVTGAGNERGTAAEFRVTGRAEPSALPRTSAKLEALDFSFRTSGLRSGRTAVEFSNTGREPHHVFFAPMQDGASLADVRRFFNGTNYVGVPPVDDVGTRDTIVLEGGERQVTELDLEAGRYAMLCFVRNRRGGQPHTKLGMISELRVP